MEFDIWSDWDSFSLKPMNWRDFCLINITGEVSEFEYFEFHFALLGLHVMVYKFKEF